jgi:hypothetical protein
MDDVLGYIGDEWNENPIQNLCCLYFVWYDIVYYCSLSMMWHNNDILEHLLHSYVRLKALIMLIYNHCR